MFEITPVSFAIFIGIGIVLVLIYGISTYNKRVEHAEDITKEQLKNLVYSLAKSLKENEEEDEQLRKKIQDLQYSDGLMREQTKFLTSNVNKTATVT